MKEAAIIFSESDHKIDQWMQTLWFKGFWMFQATCILCLTCIYLALTCHPVWSGVKNWSQVSVYGLRPDCKFIICLSSTMHLYTSCWYLSIPILKIVARGQLCVVICSACLEFSLNQTNSVCILFVEWNYMLWLWIFMCLGLLACPEFNVDKTIKVLDTIRLRLQDKGSIYSWRTRWINLFSFLGMGYESTWWQNP